MTISNILLFMPQEGKEGGGLMSFLPLILIVVVFYMFFHSATNEKIKRTEKIP